MTVREVLYLAESEVQQCMTMPEAVALAEKGILAESEGRAEGDKFYMQIRDEGFIKPFSGYLEGEDLAYVKTYSFYEGNQQKGLPVTDSIVLLFEAATGLVVCVMEANWITTLKTGASTAITAKHLARADSKIATIFGAGGQGRSHLLGLAEVFELEEVRIVDVIPEAASRYAAEMGEQTGLQITIPSSREDAVRDSDIIVTVTTGNASNVEFSWVKPGAFIAKMGSYQELDPEMLLEVDKLIVDRWEYVSYRNPEVKELVKAGKLSESDIHAEWPDIIGERAVGRESDREIILYISLGIWGEYAAILPQVYRRAKELGLGTVVGNHA
ncbi:MAG: ornithine cyclodeaminase family protein [Chloroflexi bacterium]|nr:ornithine cyclodeaminase family protein [Chloroflexota bacterium]